MREILFRGNRVDNGEWVYGHYVEDEQGASILYQNPEHGGLTRERIYPETAGQYTGMTDRNNSKIFEGDRIAFVDFLNGWETECIGEVVFSEFGWHFTNSITESNMNSYDSDDIEIIGNIHDEEEDDAD